MSTEHDAFTIRKEELAPGIWAIRLAGPVDVQTAGRVDAMVEDLFRKEIYRIVVDLKDVKFVASSGFSAFLNALSTAKGKQGDLAFLGTPKATLQLARALGLFNELKFADTEAAALDLLKG